MKYTVFITIDTQSIVPLHTGEYQYFKLTYLLHREYMHNVGRPLLKVLLTSSQNVIHVILNIYVKFHPKIFNICNAK